MVVLDTCLIFLFFIYSLKNIYLYIVKKSIDMHLQNNFKH